MTEPITFLFTDIEGSTRLWDRVPAEMERALARHDTIVRSTIVDGSGRVFKTVGDGFCCVFDDSATAILAAIAIQRELEREPWPQICEIRVRIAIAAGEARSRDGDYFGPGVNRVARLLAAAHGGQVVIDAASAVPNVPLDDLGVHSFRGLDLPERVFQVVAKGLRRTFPPLNSLDATPNNLPVQLPDLIGRDVELRQALEIARERRTRLLTLTGTGGVGKTRLALEIASTLLVERGGAFLVSLASVTGAEEIAPAIATALGVREQGGQPLAAALIDYLAGQSFVIVLDNLEQIPDAGVAVAELLKLCPKIAIIATSRESLNIRNETIVTVEPLTLAAENQDGPAVRLFLERAQLPQPGELAPVTIVAIREICRRLDGLPLAIELAAARARTIDPPKLLERLDRRFAVLTGGPRDLPSRQQTLENTIEWSFNLLTPAQRQLLLALSVFVGGWSHDHAEDIGGDKVDGVIELGALVDRHLVVSARSQGQSRYDMLESIRAFALNQLEKSGELVESRSAHAALFVRFAAEAREMLAGEQQEEWLLLLGHDHANLTAALAWLVDNGDPGSAQELALSVVRFWRMRGLLSEGRTWLERTAAARSGASDHRQAQALDEAGVFAQDLGDFAGAADLHNRAIAIFAAIDDAGGLAEVTANLATVALFRGEYDEAGRLYQESRNRFAALDDRRGVAAGLNGLGMIAFWRGDHTGAISHYERGLAEWRALGDRHSVAITLGNIGHALLANHEIDRAAAVSSEARTLFERIGDPVGIATSTLNFAFIALQRGNPELAGELFTVSGRLGLEHEDPQTTLEALLGRALVALATGDAERAAQMLAALHERRTRLGVIFPASLQTEFDGAIDHARSILTPDAYARAWSRSAGMSLDSLFEHGVD